MTPHHLDQELHNNNNTNDSNNPRTDDTHGNEFGSHSNDILSPFKQKRPSLSGLVTSPTLMHFLNTHSTSEWSANSALSNHYNHHSETVDPYRRRNASLSVLESSTLSKYPSTAFQRRYPSMSHQHFSPERRPSDGSSLYPFSDSDSHAASSPPLTSTTTTNNTPWQNHQSPVHMGIPLAMALPSIPAIPSKEFHPYPTNVQPQSAISSPSTQWPSISLQSQSHSVFNNNQTQSKATNDRSSELKISHKLAERKRRREMKDLFDELRLAIPSDDSMSEKHAKSSKWETLSRAVDFLYQVQNENNILKEENKRLKVIVATSSHRNSSSSDLIGSGLVSSFNEHQHQDPRIYDTHHNFFPVSNKSF
ncbi:hypothetical protein DFH28DRAFT_929295 [Melampsora americana]|nr:hypothetical protein DFH28DRAFT_929295 [Melampsora americana]